MSDRPMRVSGGAAVTHAEEAPSHTGRLLPGQNDTVVGWLTDRLGIVTRFVGHRDRAGGGYLLRSTGTEIPEQYQIPLLDEAP